ncbi:MFS transporter [Pediococcus damnosus]|uniref:MFS transporter n=2 Tax=Pediococcus damnosus TaxID=51663 RepID=UPI0007055354|nr:MFS transporter [Pediococcus damnosus]
MKKQFSLISLVTFFFNIVVTSVNFMVGLVFLKETGSAFVFGTLVVIGPLVSLILTPFMTKIVDQNNHKIVMLVSQIFTLVSLFLYEVVMQLLPRWNLEWTYLLIVGIRIGEELFTVCLKASVPQIVDKGNYQRVNAGMQTSIAIANISGPILGGFVFGLITLSVYVWIAILVVIVSTRFTKLIKFNEQQKQAMSSGNQTFGKVLSYLNSQGNIKSLVLIAMFVNFFASAITIGLPIVVLRQLHLSNLTYSFLDSMTSVAMLLGGVLLTIHVSGDELKTVYKSMLGFGGILFLFGIPGLAKNHSAIAIMLLVVLTSGFGLSAVFANTSMTTYIQKIVPNEIQGGIYSIINAVSQLFVPLGSLGYGILFDKFSETIIFFASGLIAVIGTVIVMKKYIFRKVMENR